MANEFVGSALYATWVSAGGTMVLNTDFRNFNYSPTIDFVDATAGADTARQRINSFKDGQITASILILDNWGTAIYNPLIEGVSGTVIWGPAGSAAGKLKFAIPARVASSVQNVPYADVAVLDITWQQDGAGSVGVWP